MGKKAPPVTLRKPPAVDPVAASRFVSGQTSKRPDVQASAPRGIVERKRSEKTRRMTVYLPPDLATRLAVYCAQHGRDMSDVVTEAVARTLERPGV